VIDGLGSDPGSRDDRAPCPRAAWSAPRQDRRRLQATTTSQGATVDTIEIRSPDRRAFVPSIFDAVGAGLFARSQTSRRRGYTVTYAAHTITTTPMLLGHVDPGGELHVRDHGHNTVYVGTEHELNAGDAMHAVEPGGHTEIIEHDGTTYHACTGTGTSETNFVLKAPRQPTEGGSGGGQMPSSPAAQR
jgi:hypothetical protein